MNPTLIRALVAALGLLIVGVMLVDWNSIAWQGGRQGTEDAQLRGDPIFLTAQVSGYVTKVGVDDDQPVQRGQVLYQLEQDDYQARVHQAEAAVAEAVAGVAEMRAQLALQQERVRTATATAQVTAARLVFARQEQVRWNALAGTEGGLLRAQQSANADAHQQTDTLDADRHSVDANQDQVRALAEQLRQQEATVQMRRHALDLAKIAFRWTEILAPADGTVGTRTVRPGDYVTPGRPVIAFVPRNDIWAVAYYREEQVTDMRVGQAVDIHVDAFPDITLHGHVDSFEPAAQYWTEQLVPDRATGNFTKVVQRIPVKIVFDAPEPLDSRLIPGLSVETYVHTDGQTRPLEAR